MSPRGASGAVVLMTGNPRVEEARKNLPRRFLRVLHAELRAAIRGARGIDLIVASDGREGFRLETDGETRVVRCSGLADRIDVAIDTARSWGYGSVVVVAGDVTGLDSAGLETAFETLARTDCVFAPSSDGGFALVGLTSGALLDWTRIPWFSNEAADGLRRELERVCLEWAELARIDDIDDRVSARHAIRTPLLSRRVRASLLGRLGSTVVETDVIVRARAFAPDRTIHLRAPPRFVLA